MLIKFFTTLHVSLFRLSGGRVGNRLGKQSALLLHTVGRNSAKDYYTTLSYYRDGDNYLVVASNWGKESDPDWYLNLIQQPKTTIQVGSKILNVEARPAEGEDYQRLWVLVTRKNEQYITYQNGMKRRIPIMILSPTLQP